MEQAAETGAEVACFELPLEEPPQRTTDTADILDLDLLYQNAAWFCRLRWIVVAILAAAGFAAALGVRSTSWACGCRRRGRGLPRRCWRG